MASLGIRQFFRRAAVAATTLCGVLGTTQSLSQTPGDFDRSFGPGTGFVANISIGIPQIYPSASMVAMAVQPDGKYVLAGSCLDFGPIEKFCAMRLNADGTLDSTFNGPDPVAPGNGKFMFPFGTGNSSATALLLQPDGKLVLAGNCELAGNSEFCVARLNVDGSFDETFNGPDVSMPGNGKFMLPGVGRTGNHQLGSAALHADGRIALAGSCSGGINDTFYSVVCVATLNPNGTYDVSFNGPDVSAPGHGQFTFRISSGYDFPSAIVIQPDTKVLIAGRCETGSPNGQNLLCITRLLRDGTVDAVDFFGGGGGAGSRGKILLGVTQAGHQLGGIALQADGRIVLAGTCTTSVGTYFCGTRILANGITDATIAARSDSPVGVISAGRFLVNRPLNAQSANTVFVQSDGRILITGKCDAGSAGTQYSFCMARLNSDGNLDTTFDGAFSRANGAVAMQLRGSNDFVTSSMLLHDGRIVLAGQCYDGFTFYRRCVARFRGGPFEAPRCSLDIDGDGRILAATDLLMLMRISRGATGDAVTQSIRFESHATRTAWPTLRTYLISQCGMTLTP